MAEVDRDEIAHVAGVLESARDCLAAGFVGKLKHLIHAEMFDSLLQQAEALLKAGHTIPAAVLGRIVIEDWLRDQAEKAGITVAVNEKASVINDSLKKAGVITASRWRQVQSYLDIGNAAAHGRSSEITMEDVGRQLEFAKTACT